MENLQERSITCELHTASHNCTRLFIFPCAGKAGSLRLNLWWTYSCAFFLFTRGRGCGQHPAFPAPSVFEGSCADKTRAKGAAGMASHASSLSSRANGSARSAALHHQRRFQGDAVADGNVAGRDHLGIDAAFVMTEAAHQRLRDLEIARSAVGIDVDGGATGDPLDHLQSRFANCERAADQIGLLPRRPTLKIEVGAEAERVDGAADQGFDCLDAREIDDRDDLLGDIRKTVAAAFEQLRRTPELARKIHNEKCLDRRAALGRFQVAARLYFAVPADGQHVAGVLEMAAQAGQPLDRKSVV